MTTQGQSALEDQTKETLYKVSFEKLEALGRSAIYVLASRLPESAPSINSPNYSDLKPQKLVDEIAKHSKGQEGYITTDMPIQEMVFRIILGKRNRPMSLSDIHNELTEKWSTPIRPITISQTGLMRILDSDTYYGFIEA